MQFKNFTMTLVALMLVASSAFALDLHEARATGLVGEGNNGYVVAIAKTAEAKALAGEVNDKRREEYQRISKENNQTVDVVAKIAAEKIIANLKDGEQYQDANGKWQKR